MKEVYVKGEIELKIKTNKDDYVLKFHITDKKSLFQTIACLFLMFNTECNQVLAGREDFD